MPFAPPLKIYQVDDETAPYLVRYDEFAAGSYVDAHSHRLGHLNYTAYGTMTIETQGKSLIAPPQYGVWIPPGVEHNCYVQQAIVYRSFYVQPDLCADLPNQACIMRISAIARSVLTDLAHRNIRRPSAAEDVRLAQVMLDQMRLAKSEHSYLPQARSASLGAVLDALTTDPGSRRSVAEWAQSVHLTERTLARHCVHELGMGLAEWRQRLRHLCAVEALGLGQTVQEIAFDLGYSTASAFIAMFQREAGMPPEQFRREFGMTAHQGT